MSAHVVISDSDLEIARLEEVKRRHDVMVSSAVLWNPFVLSFWSSLRSSHVLQSRKFGFPALDMYSQNTFKLAYTDFNFRGMCSMYNRTLTLWNTSGGYKNTRETFR